MNLVSEQKMGAADYLKKPYARQIVPEQDGSFRAEILEFPGCIALGDTQSEALTSLEKVAKSWLEAALEMGQHIPEPVETNAGYSGKLVLRLPKSLHRKAVYAANREGVSLNQFIVSSVAEQVGIRSAQPQLAAQPAPAFAQTHVQSHGWLWSINASHKPKKFRPFGTGGKWKLAHG